jgi:hypothetical protein
VNLPQLLLTNGINTDNWLRELGNKTIDDLAAEISARETILESIDGTLMRVIKIANIFIQIQLGDKLFALVEDKQIFFTGAIRQRNLKHLAEKIQGDETPLEAAKRAVKEEINLDFTGEWNFRGEEITVQKSPSYPGLSSRYQIFNYQIILSTAELERLKFAEVRQQKISLFTLEAIDG